MNPNNPRSTTLPVGIPPRFAFMAWTLEAGRSLSRLKIPLCAIALFCALTLSGTEGQAQEITNPSPVADACAYNSSPPSLTSGKFGFVQCDSTGSLRVSGNFSLVGTASNAADGVATSTNNLSTVNYPFLWNGATFDRWKGDATNGAFVNVKVLPALVAGSAIIGNVRIDQTTPGTTNGVQVNAALPAGTNVIGKATIDQTSPGTTNAVSVQYGSTALVADPCQSVAKTFVPISQATNTKLFSQTSAKKNYICSIMTVGADAENLSLVEGTGSVCGTSTAAIIGGTTAATGPNFAANGGFALGSGIASVAAGTNANFDVCLFQSGAGRVAGVLTYVQQ